jgi:hypothetical protein
MTRIFLECWARSGKNKIPRSSVLASALFHLRFSQGLFYGLLIPGRNAWPDSINDMDIESIPNDRKTDDI